MSVDDPIERYLDELLVELRGSPRAVRRVLAETEAHLRDAVDAGVDPEEAIRRFGPAREVAATANRQTAVPLGVLVRQLALAACLLGAIACAAIGVSGLVAVGMDAAFGPKFVAGDLPTISYTADRCAEYRILAPNEASCLAAAARHHADEVETTRVAAGFLGAVLFAAWWVVRRRWRTTPATGALPPAFVSSIGTAVFAVATMALAAQSLQAFGWKSTAGLGQWLSAAVVSGCATAGFAVVMLRGLRRPQVS